MLACASKRCLDRFICRRQYVWFSGGAGIQVPLHVILSSTSTPKIMPMSVPMLFPLVIRIHQIERIYVDLHVQMDGWMDGCVDEWMDGWID
jgi:hypothetical protein